MARYKQNFGSRFTLGALATDRKGCAYHNGVAGFDVDLRLEAAHVWERMTVDEGRLCTASVSDLTTAWYFSACSFVPSVVQYVDYRYEPGLYTDGRAPRPLHGAIPRLPF